MTRLHVFDMDGTLLPGTTASTELARHTGHSAELADLEARFAAGELDTRGFARAAHALWSGLRRADVEHAWSRMPRLAGITEVFADIRDRGETAIVVTMSPDFLARGFLDMGAGQVVASRWPAVPFRTALDPAGILTPEDKPRIAAAVCARLGLSADDTVAYGDSMSDAPLFRRLRHTVAINADHHLTDLAALSYRGADLRAAYALLRTHLDGN